LAAIVQTLVSSGSILEALEEAITQDGYEEKQYVEDYNPMFRKIFSQVITAGYYYLMCFINI